MTRNKARRLASPLPKDTVHCGELTLDPSQPHNNIIPFPKDIALDIRSTPIVNIHTIQNTTVGADIGAQLMTFLTAQAHALHLDRVQIKAPEATRYLVYNSETAFKRACGNPAIRDWLQERVIDEGRLAVMIVGMYTYSNATYVQLLENKVGGRASASIPTSLATANAAIGVSAVAQDHHAFGMPEEHIFAIEYKRVKYKTWTKKKVEDARLEAGPNRWEVFFGDRSKGSAGSDQEENIYEFNLDEGTDANDDEDQEEQFEDEDKEEQDCEATSMGFEGSLIDY